MVDIHKLNQIRKKLLKSNSREEYIRAFLDYQEVKPEDREKFRADLIKELDRRGIKETLDKHALVKIAKPFIKR